MSKPIVEPRLYQTASAAKYLGLSPEALLLAVELGSLPAFRLPSTRKIGELTRVIFFDRIDLDKFVDKAKRSSQLKTRDRRMLRRSKQALLDVKLLLKGQNEETKGK